MVPNEQRTTNTENDAFVTTMGKCYGAKLVFYSDFMTSGQMASPVQHWERTSLSEDLLRNQSGKQRNARPNNNELYTYYLRIHTIPVNTTYKISIVLINEN